MKVKNIVSITLLCILFIGTSAFSSVKTYEKVNVESDSLENTKTVYLGDNTFELINETNRDIKKIEVVDADGVSIDALENAIATTNSSDVHFTGDIKDIYQLFTLKITYADDKEKELVNIPLKLLKSATIKEEDKLVYVDYVLLTNEANNTKDNELAIKEEKEAKEEAERLAAEEAARKEAEEAAAAAAEYAAQQAAANYAAQQTIVEQPVIVDTPVETADEGCLSGALFGDD